MINSPSAKLKKNDKVEITLIHNQEQKLTPKNIKLDIIYEDKDILIINKNYLSIHIAIPMPPPIQRVAKPFLTFLLIISCIRVTSILVPEAPIG